jgi:hypothetical protein
LLHEEEIGHFLQHDGLAWGLVVIADVVITMGALNALFEGVPARLRSGGGLALSAEAAQAWDIEIDPCRASVSLAMPDPNPCGKAAASHRLALQTACRAAQQCSEHRAVELFAQRAPLITDRAALQSRRRRLPAE